MPIADKAQHAPRHAGDATSEFSRKSRKSTGYERDIARCNLVLHLSIIFIVADLLSSPWLEIFGVSFGGHVAEAIVDYLRRVRKRKDEGDADNDNGKSNRVITREEREITREERDKRKKLISSRSVFPARRMRGGARRKL